MSDNYDVQSDPVEGEASEVEKDNVFTDKKDLNTIAKEVLAGDWGEGVQRRAALSEAGYDPNEVREEMARILNPEP